jgi:hypothetical protein
MNAPVVQAAPSSTARVLPRSVPWKMLLVTIALAGVLIGVEFVWLRWRQEARTAAWANEQVREQIAAARAHLAEQHWDEAIRHLEDALTEEKSTNRAEILPVLEEAQRGQAEAMLASAGVAARHKNTADALRLLHAYLAHPQATHLDRARQLRDDLERALSDEEAARLLARLSDEALAIFAEQGQMTESDGLHTAAHAVFVDTLRRNVPHELRKRAARREVARLSEERHAAERARRIARLRGTPSFQSLTAFLERTREEFRTQQQLGQRQDKELGELFQELGVNDAAEKERFRSDLLGRESPADFRVLMERQRAESKRAYRNSADFRAADQELFEQLVDQELDKLLRKILPSEREADAPRSGILRQITTFSARRAWREA